MVFSAQSSQDGVSFLTCSTLIQSHLLLSPLVFLVDELCYNIIFAESFKSFCQFLWISIDQYFSSLFMFCHIFMKFFNALLIDFAIVSKVSDKASQAILSFQDRYLFMKCFYLITDKLCDIYCFFFIVNLQILVFIDGLSEQLLLVCLEHAVQLFDDFLFVLHKLVMDTFPESYQIIKDLIIRFVELFEDNDVLITLLFSLCDDLLKVDVGWLIILQEVLLCMLNNAVRTQRHQAFTITTKIGQKFVGMIGAVYLPDFAILRKSCMIDS